MVRLIYDGTMDVLCKLPNGEMILVEMQVIPKTIGTSTL